MDSSAERSVTCQAACCCLILCHSVNSYRICYVQFMTYSVFFYKLVAQFIDTQTGPNKVWRMSRKWPICQTQGSCRQKKETTQINTLLLQSLTAARLSSEMKQTNSADLIVALMVLLDSSVTTVNRLGAQRSGVLFPAEVTDFSLLQSLQIGAGAHPVSCLLGR